ncbi:MAG: helix-turn-helix transcriptional regulator [Lachnospiraceae bacterium]|jgi:transcriptional regulator with XRE-family HTH domain|nr:helix-turn-helix transcriptional regulator [Lachnospiraceae bacterium]
MPNKLAGQRIMKSREKQHYTREALAERIGISDKYLYEIETGSRGFSAEILCRLSNALSVSCDYIIMGEEKEHRGMENLISALEMVEPKYRSRMREILRILCEMCASIRIQ